MTKGLTDRPPYKFITRDDLSKHAFGDGREEEIDHVAIKRAYEDKFCPHPFENLLEIRGSIMCGVCHREIDRYGSPLHEAMKWWQQRKPLRGRVEEATSLEYRRKERP